MRSVNERTEMNASESRSSVPRVRVVDAVRGLAVLFMIQWHCADGWLGGEIREEEAFAWLRVVGGLAAPLFLLLAGTSLGLTFRREALGASVRRGLAIVVMGYALKLFAWAVDFAAIAEPNNWPALALDALTLSLAWHALQEKRTPRERVILSVLGFGAWFATWTARAGTTCSPDVMLRLDVLQGIGAALVVTAGLLALAHRTRLPALAMALAAIAVALATPSMFGVDLWFLPQRFADYVARTTVEPAASGARFPLFPWAGYALFGAAIGCVVRARPSTDAWAMPLTKRPALVLAVALALAVIVYEPNALAQAVLVHGEQPRNLVRLVFNASLAIALAAACSLALPRVPRVADVVLLLGRHSLIVYAVHLELAYGMIAIPVHQRMGFLAWALGVTLVVVAMIAMARALDARDARARAPRTGPELARA